MNDLVNNINLRFIIIGVIALLILYLIVKIMKLPIKLLLNGISGFITIILINKLLSYYSLIIPLNPLNALISGFLGIPGVILLVVYYCFI